MNYNRRLRYFIIRLTRIKGDPHYLALGVAIGIFAGMLPIVPFHTVLAIALAIFFKGSKISAAIGTWVSNPVNWAFIYYLDYKLGSMILCLPEKNKAFLNIMKQLREDEAGVSAIMNLLSSGFTIITAFLMGGLIIGIIVSIPSYYIFLNIFRYIHRHREKRKDIKTRSTQERSDEINDKTE
ncbi:MAG: DUF2062 domain-containing protein [Deltaproteobacteria bacterium]|nr:DUF2062 domain-containing protein [Deltaproteobacteria bacterium]